ncbi:hypothetical protein [Bradyrhizobium sp. sGM-13]|uniref:hypothetical protein n=1 Tax=Bradyrhizobium sp. sGM-13 TaxID=2831781 RepID=UPI001BCB8436|nr:hypothetical protein [Bradyrhizobium sp. sGM-13]
MPDDFGPFGFDDRGWNEQQAPHRYELLDEAAFVEDTICGGGKGSPIVADQRRILTASMCAALNQG